MRKKIWHRRRSKSVIRVAVVVGISSALTVQAQEVVPTSQSGGALTVSARLGADFQRTVALNLENVTLKEALQAVAAQAGIVISYGTTVVPVAKRVSLVSSLITVHDALTSLLENTGTEAVAVAPGLIAVRPTGDRSASDVVGQQGAATLTGSVRDSGTGASISQVTVHVDGTSLSVKSSADGQYKFTNIAAGEYRVTARRVGYLAKTRTVTLTDGDNKKLDFGLNPPATQLNEVVTTALGEQRRYQVGNVISTINVDSVAPNAPITSVTDLLAARVPGLEVVQSNGLAGAGPAIRIRGQSSLILQSDPIIIVDGIRVDNTPGNDNALGLQFAIVGTAPARINDLDFNEIESISVLKGPTATTEYGTDAANGVIVITTKRGHAGTPMWDASVTESAVIIPKTFGNYYWDWGHLANGTGTPMYAEQQGVPCNQGVPFSSGLPPLTAGSCVVDSITAFNPLNHAATTDYGTGPSDHYDLSVGGGTEQVRYYLAGDVQNEEGLLHVPDVFRSQATALGYSNSVLKPNSQNQERLSANGTIQLSPRVQIAINGGYTTTYYEAPTAGVFSGYGWGSGPVLDDSAFQFGYGAPPFGTNNLSPLVSLGQTLSQETEAWRGSSTLDWRPLPWAAAHMTAGIEHEAQTDGFQRLAQAELVANLFSDSSAGTISQDQIRNDVYTVDMAASATWGVARYLQLITTLGAQYTQTTAQGITATAYGLPASAFSLNDGTSGNIQIGQSASSAATEGVYAEEQVNLGDRCSMPLALRLDAGSAFGSAVGSQDYPKWGLTCRVLTGTTTLRLRGAFGAAGVQPPQGSAQSQFTTESVQYPGESQTATYQFVGPGNPNIRPEDDREWEGGADLNAWGSRLSISVTAYTKYAHNALYTVGLGELLQGAYTENVGDIRNMGEELEVTVVPVAQRDLTASLTLSASVNRNKLLRLAPDILSQNLGNGQYFAPGYPMFGYFGDSIRYQNANRDGILLLSNVMGGQPGVGGRPTLYMGSSIPIKQMAMQPSIAFFRQELVQVNAVFQYQGGFKVANLDAQNSNYSLTGQATSVLGTPLWLQAYSMVSELCCGGPYANQYLSGDYLSWNELSVAVGLPEAWRRTLRLRNVHVVVGVQNLALWTAYPFGDPRVSGGAVITGNNATNSLTAENDLRATGASVTPLPRTWMVRFNIGL